MLLIATLAGLSVCPRDARLVLADPRPQPTAGVRRLFRDLRRFVAAEARQGVAVDADHFYAIGDREIGKYEKASGKKVGAWRSPAAGPITHLNDGKVIDGRLYCAHSNYPNLPMISSIEIFETSPLRHLTSHNFGVFEGSATWVDRSDGHWWVTFAHYQGRGGEPGKGTASTVLVAFDEHWRPVARYLFPTQVVQRFQPYSNSGGSWGADGLLYVTGHDAAEVYTLRLPETGTVLALADVIPAPIAGQGIAWDRGEPGVLYGIIKARKEVVVSRLLAGETLPLQR